MEESINIVKQNLSTLSEKSAAIDRLTKDMYHELAWSFKNNSVNLDLESIPRIYEQIWEKNPYESFSKSFALFCHEFVNVFGESFGFFQSDYEADVYPIGIAYMQNSFSDMAYKKFASLFSKTTASYFNGFREACEDVYYGRSSHAIIPIYSSKDGQFLSFRRLISMHDLKISYETDIETSDESIIRFALVQKGLNISKNSNYIDLSVVFTDNQEVGEFISSCESINASVIMANSIPTEYSDDRLKMNFQLKINRRDQYALYLFLNGAHIRYDVSGIYDVII